MFGFIKLNLLECLGYFNVANGRKPLLELFPDISKIVNSEVFEATISSAQIKKPRQTIRK